MYISIKYASNLPRENLFNRDSQIDTKPKEKCYFT